MTTKEHFADFAVPPAELRTTTRSERLRQAIHLGGGNKKVSEATGIGLTNIQNYLKGREMRIDTALALAEACGVTLEWLATGKDPAPQAPPAAAARPPKLFSFVDTELLAAAVQGAIGVFEAKGAAIEGRAFGQIVCLLYDEGNQRIADMRQDTE